MSFELSSIFNIQNNLHGTKDITFTLVPSQATEHYKSALPLQHPTEYVLMSCKEIHG